MRKLIGRGLLWFIGPALLERQVRTAPPAARARDEREVLLDEIEAYLAMMPRPIAETTFGLRSVNDGKFVSRLRKKQNVTLDRIEKCRRFMAENVPVRGAVH